MKLFSQIFGRASQPGKPIQISSIDSLELVLAFIGTTSLAAIGLLVFHLFYVSLVLCLGLVFAIALCAALRVRPRNALRKPDRWLLAAILVAFVLRLFPSTHYLGGQDQGLYVAMQEMYLRFHGLEFANPFRVALGPDIIPAAEYVSGYFFLIPGMVLRSWTSGVGEIPFYPLHPAWMALGTGVLGRGFHTYAVVAESLIGVWVLYAITDFFSDGDLLAARIVAFLGALNPALVFFAKFPVSETLTMTLSLGSALLLARALREPDQRRAAFQWTASLLLLLCLPFARFTVWMLLPTGALLLTVAVLWSKSNPRLRWLYPYGALFVVGAGLSVVFYLRYFPYLTVSLWRDVFESKFLLITRPVVVAVAVGSLAISAAAVWWRYRTWMHIEVAGRNLLNTLSNFTPNAFILLVLVSIPSMVQWYVVREFNNFPEFVLPPDPWIFRFHSLYRLMLLLGPSVTLALLLMPLAPPSRRASLSVLSFFLITAWLVMLLWNSASLYLYFNGRYLISEVLPATLVLGGIVLAHWIHRGGRWRLLAWACLGFALIYSAAFSLVQWRWTDGEQSPDVLYDLADVTNPKDLLLVEPAGLPGLDFGVVGIASTSTWLARDAVELHPDTRHKTMERLFHSPLVRKYERVLLFTGQPPEMVTALFNATLVKEWKTAFRFLTNDEHVHSGGFYRPNRPGYTLPYRRSQRQRTVYLYEIKDPPFQRVAATIPFTIDFFASGNSQLFAHAGWALPTGDGTWTVGESASMLWKAGHPSSERETIISILGRANAVEGKKQRIEIKLNEESVGMKSLGSDARWLHFPVPSRLLKTGGENMIELGLPDAHSPYSDGRSLDTRHLGIFVQYIAVGQPAISLPLRVEFADSGNSRLYTREGWSRPEQTGQWTEGRMSEMQGRLVGIRRGLGATLSFTASAFAPAGEFQRVVVKANGTNLGEVKMGPTVAKISLPVPEAVLMKDPVLRLTFELPDAKSPKSRWVSEDSRVLGIFLSELTLSQ